MVISWFKNTGSQKVPNQNKENNSKNPGKKDLMEFFTETGDQILIEKEEYRKKVLPHNIQLNWNNPQKLYDTILGALRDNFDEDILNAAKRLLEIDSNHERSYCMSSIVLMKNQHIQEAKSLLESHVKKIWPIGNSFNKFSKNL